ncbi:NACHT domain-containing protein [Kitasatospora sp. NPDC004289]
MSAGRPPKGEQEYYPELRELATWFRQALASAGYGTPNSFIRTGFAGKAAVYGVHNASRLLTLEFTKALAIALGRDPAEVVPIWTRAKEARDRATTVQQGAKAPRPSSWSEVPVPALALRNLLEAQAAWVDRLPYDILDVKEPPLSAIYVRQQIRAMALARESGPGSGHRVEGDPQQAPTEQTTAPGRDTVLPLTEVLGRPGHILVTGEPGSGKSTLTSHLTWWLSRIWLREKSLLAAPSAEPLVPLRIAARTLVGHSGSWSAALCEATRQSMGHSLVADPEPGLFAERVQGVRWLVMVDGLDEVTDRQARNQIIRTISQHARTDGAYRFLVTTRPLPENELTPLRTAAFTEFQVEPFSPAELRDFADQWFRAQGLEERETEAAVARFLQETEDGRLSELVRNPLLATIAAVSATIDPSRSLPANRVSLYQLFFENLLNRSAERGGGRQPTPLESWFRRFRQELIEAIAQHRIESDGSLEAAAREWARQRLPEGIGTAGRWEPELRQLLLDSGLLVLQGNDLRFLHHSFAEFLAAQAYARAVPPDFPDLDAWVGRGISEAEHTLVLFTFRLWADREECDADLIVDHLLTGMLNAYNLANLAGLLIAEGAKVSAGRVSVVLQRLEDSARSEFQEEQRVRAFTTLAGLASLPEAGERLRRLATSPVLMVTQRLQALEALSRVVSRSEAEELLARILGGTYGVLPSAARVARTIGVVAQDLVRQRALSMQDEVWVDSWEWGVASRTLEVLGRTEEVEDLARRVLADPGAHRADIEWAAEAWLKASSGHCADEIVELALRRPAADHEGRDALARMLGDHGAPVAAVRLARVVLTEGKAQAAFMNSAAKILSQTSEGDGAEVIRLAWANVTPSAGQPPYLKAWLARSIAEAGAQGLAAEWAKEVLTTYSGATHEMSLVVAAWLAAEGSAAAPEIMRILREGELLSPHERSRCARELMDAGAAAEGRSMAELALRTPLLGSSYYEEAATVLVKALSADAGIVLEEIVAGEAGGDPEWLDGVIEALEEGGAGPLRPLRRALARMLVSLPTATGSQRLGAQGTLLEIEGLAYLPEIVAAVKGSPRFSLKDVRHAAKGLANMGQREAALECWQWCLEILRPPDSQELELLQDILAADVGAEAVGWLREMSVRPGLSDLKRLRLRQMLAWLEPALAPEA